jgi:hypothetical protein
MLEALLDLDGGPLLRSTTHLGGGGVILVDIVRYGTVDVVAEMVIVGCGCGKVDKSSHGNGKGQTPRPPWRDRHALGGPSHLTVPRFDLCLRVACLTRHKDAIKHQFPRLQNSRPLFLAPTCARLMR